MNEFFKLDHNAIREHEDEIREKICDIYSDDCFDGVVSVICELALMKLSEILEEKE